MKGFSFLPSGKDNLSFLYLSIVHTIEFVANEFIPLGTGNNVVLFGPDLSICLRKHDYGAREMDDSVVNSG